MTNGALGLSQDQFWDLGPVMTQLQDQLVDRVCDEGFSGLVADAPRSVALASQRRLPLVAGFARTLRDDAHLDIGRQLLLVGSDHETHAVVVKLAAPPDKPKPRRRPPTRDPGPGSTFSVLEIDAAARLAMQDFPGRWSFRLIIREFCSDVLETELGASAGGFRDEAAERLIAERRRQHPPPPPSVWPPHPVAKHHRPPPPYPRYGDDARAPEPPEELGVKLELDRAVVANEPCMLRGSFRLRALPREVVGTRRYKRLGGGSERLRPPVGDPRAEAILPLTLVLTGVGDPGPHVLRLQLPAYTLEHPPAGGDPIATGRFEIDLFTLGAMPQAMTTYFVHAFHGPHALGPLQLAIVSPAAIR